MELPSTLILFIFNLNIKSCGILGWCHCTDIPDFMFFVAPHNLALQVLKCCSLKPVSMSSYCWIFLLQVWNRTSSLLPNVWLKCIWFILHPASESSSTVTSMIILYHKFLCDFLAVLEATHHFGARRNVQNQ